MKEHLKHLKKIDSDFKIIKRFEGGMSNFTYLVEKKHEKFVYRYPGKGASNFVDYIAEEHNLKQVEELKIVNDLVYFNSKTGEKLVRYIEGEQIIAKSNVTQVAQVLKKLHQSDLKLKSNYNHLQRIEKYQSLHQHQNQKYYQLLTEFKVIYQKYLEKNINFPCHNDTQVANFIVTPNEEIYLLDWEFSAYNDPIYDIACFGNKDFDSALELLLEYYNSPTNEQYLRVYAWRMFQCLQWFNVAYYKHDIKLGKDLNIDFEFVAKNYLKLAEQFYEKVKEYQNLLNS